MKKLDLKMVFITFISVILMGLALTVLNYVNLGNDPFTYMNIQIAGKIGWSLGNWQVLLNVIMFIPVIIWARDQIGIGTIFNMVLVGYSIDFFTWICEKISFGDIFSSMAIRLVVMVPAIILFVFAAATYMTTGLGTAPYDAMPFLISKKLTKVEFKWIRMAVDFTVVAIGFILSKQIGIVSVLMVLFMGQTVKFVKEKVMKR
ncbi:MAG: hypothetical protein J6L69_06210 [Lachnospiraceae bacterium]|nr:hypothetical protein [Lachnospiraceae bacterium]